MDHHFLYGKVEYQKGTNAGIKFVKTVDTLQLRVCIAK